MKGKLYSFFEYDRLRIYKSFVSPHIMISFNNLVFLLILTSIMVDSDAEQEEELLGMQANSRVILLKRAILTLHHYHIQIQSYQVSLDKVNSLKLPVNYEEEEELPVRVGPTCSLRN